MAENVGRIPSNDIQRDRSSHEGPMHLRQEPYSDWTTRVGERRGRFLYGLLLRRWLQIVDRDTMRVIRIVKSAGSFVLHSQTTNTRHPHLRRSRHVRRSRDTFSLNFFCQKAIRVFGV